MKSALQSDYPRIGVGVIILRNNMVLLGRRKGPRAAGQYGLPGGLLENNESFEMCAKREVWEETGLEDMFIYPVFYLKWNDGVAHYIDIIFCAACDGGEPIIREIDRVENWEWFSFTELPAPLYKPTDLAIRQFMHDIRVHSFRMFLQKWLFRFKRLMLFNDALDQELP